MKRSRFTEEPIIKVLKQAEAGTPTAELCRQHGISKATFFAWKSKFTGMDVSDAKKLRGLEIENTRLGTLIAYCLRPNKPSLRLTNQDHTALQAIS